MAMTLRLSSSAEERLDHLAQETGLSKNTLIEQAIIEKDARTSQVGRALAHVDRITVRDAEILERLADR